MALDVRLVQKLGQSLLMTPQLQQAIKLLQLGRLEFKEELERELMENPVLEEAEPSEAPEIPQFSGDEGGNSSSEASENATNGESIIASENQDSIPQAEQSKIDWEGYLDSFTDSHGASAPKHNSDSDERPAGESNYTKNTTLTEYLVDQLRYMEINEDDRRVAMHIVGNLDKNGYLCSSSEELAEEANCTPDDIERALTIVRTMDPAGVGARNLSECLLIQLENLGLGEGLEARIVSRHMEFLEKQKYQQIAKLEQVAVEEVYKAITAIRNLEPHPGRPFADETIRYITPDIHVYKVGSEYVISLNEDGLPKLKVSPYYMELLRRKDAENLPNYEYLQNKLKAASWLIRSIHQRQGTIYKVTESIVKFQREFFDHGIEKLKPLVLKDVAADIGMHESTVSRVTTNKYVHTPQGIFELKFFFTTGIKSGDGDMSSSTVREKIRALITAERPDAPISDQEIVDSLAKDDITIARRTVAKYRENMGIQASSRRKKLF